jgi:hypothetical protein
MRRTLLLAPLLALTVSACAGTQQTNSASKFKGDQGQIAQLVDDLAKAGTQGDSKKICTQILASELVNELKQAGGDCVTEMDRAIKDASDYDLQVVSVKVSGSTATARVRQGKTGKVATFSFIKEKPGWRASALGG